MGIWDKAARTETMLALGSRGWGLLKDLGLADKITSTLWLGLLAGWGTILLYLQVLPGWALLLTGLFFATCVLKLVNEIKVWRSLRGVKHLDLQQLGAECSKLHADFADMMSLRKAPSWGDGPAEQYFSKSAQFRDETAALIRQKFTVRVYAIAVKLRRIGIPPPPLFHFASGDAGGALVYIGIVGQLLQQGLLEEAKQLDANLTWGAT